eukprot:7671629-Lingulodinium_polyedra.AAC.1
MEYTTSSCCWLLPARTLGNCGQLLSQGNGISDAFVRSGRSARTLETRLRTGPLAADHQKDGVSPTQPSRWTRAASAAKRRLDQGARRHGLPPDRGGHGTGAQKVPPAGGLGPPTWSLEQTHK